MQDTGEFPCPAEGAGMSTWASDLNKRIEIIIHN